MLVLRRAKTADVLRVPTLDSLQRVDARETKVKKNGVSAASQDCLLVGLVLICGKHVLVFVTVRLLLLGSLETGQSDHIMIRTVNNSQTFGFNRCFPSTRDWFNWLWLKFNSVLVLQSDWPVLFK